MFENVNNMKPLLFLGYLFVAFMLYFVPSKIWHDEKLEIRKKYSNDSEVVERAFMIYEGFKGLTPNNATDRFIYYIDILASSFKTICTVHQDSRIILNMACSPEEPVEPCDMKKDLQTLLKDWKSSNDQISEFNALVKVFNDIVKKDAYVTYIIQMQNDQVITIKDGFSSTDTSESELVNLSKQNITQLLNKIGLIRHFLDNRIEKTKKDMKDMTDQDQSMQNMCQCSTYHNPELEEVLYKLSMNLKLLTYVEHEATDAILKIVTLLNSQNFWEKSMTASVEVQIYFFAWNTFLMLSMYFYPFYVYSILFYAMLFSSIIYKRFIGDPVYLRSSYIFSFLQITIAENDLKHRNRRKARNKHRRIRKM